jgi:hypothetical protein
MAAQGRNQRGRRKRKRREKEMLRSNDPEIIEVNKLRASLGLKPLK